MKYNVFKGKKDLVERIFQRDEIPYEIFPDPKRDGAFILEADIGRGRWEEILEDVACEIQRGDSPIPVYGRRTMANPKKFARLRELNKTGCFFLLKKAEEDIYL
jgi:hypothetical protein